MDTQTALGNSGAPYTVEWRGTTYPVRFPDMLFRAKLELAAKQSAVAEALGMRELGLPEEDVQAALSGIADDVRKGAYRFDKPADAGGLTQQFTLSQRGYPHYARALLDDRLTLEEAEMLFLEKSGELTQIAAMMTAGMVGTKKPDAPGDDTKSGPG